jgi:hypothetical protein
MLAKDILTDTVIDISSEIELGPKSVLILELQKFQTSVLKHIDKTNSEMKNTFNSSK